MKNAIFLVLSILAFGAQAADKIDWAACSKEMKEFKCAGDDKAIWACLDKNDSKLSTECQTPHTVADGQFKK